LAAEQLKPLTSLRFFAAVWVVLHHYWPHLGLAEPAFVAKGYLGVELFFVLSGFILSHVYLGACEEGRFRYGGFLWARIARIYPLHLATIAGVGLMGAAALAAGRHVDPNAISLAALPSNLLLLQAWGFSPVAGWNHPSWSISAEWFAYLSFPAFAWAAAKLRHRPQLAMAASILGLFGAYALFQRLTGEPLTNATIAWGALRIVPPFAYGCAAYLAWRGGAVDRPGLAAATAALSLAGIVLLAAAGGADAVIVSLFGFLILGLAGLSARPGLLLSRAPFVWLGEISYAIYMICIPWKLLFPNLLALAGGPDSAAPMPLGVWLAFTIALIPLAGLTHHLIERPARKALRRLPLRTPKDHGEAKFA
jgi:peptidoglycan/LPS O-acetylase OafA/YrhL